MPDTSSPVASIVVASPVLSQQESVSDLYPGSPSLVPPELTRPSKAYRLSAFQAVAALLLFFGFFLAIGFWFGWLSYYLLFEVVPKRAGGTGSVIAGLGAGLLCIFTFSALLLRGKKAPPPPGVEVTDREQPELLAFVRRVAREVGASPPRRVYISGRVNAAVSYDVSFVNLLLPLRRDLEIGLGLVNVLTLAELKAVLAHEFGHFGQRTMLLGRWVYVSAQIATRIVSGRSRIEGALIGLTRSVGFHPIWLVIWLVAWVLRLAVWSIRSIMDACFGLLLLSQRVLSRQMEFQADLVAVSVTGSDPLVQALYKLQLADEALNRTGAFAIGELSRGHRVPDLFALQSTALERSSRVMGSRAGGGGGLPLTIAAQDRSSYRLFGAGFAPAPNMWATHPSCVDREENCKRHYVASDYPETSAWLLFADSQALRERTSLALLRGNTEAAALCVAESVRSFEQEFERPYLDPRYRGVYASRCIARWADQPRDLYGPPPGDSSISGELQALYGASLQSDVNLLRALSAEREGLTAVQRDASVQGAMRFRGRPLARTEVAAALEQVVSEWSVVNARLIEHDQRCRASHMAAAVVLGGGWPRYLEGLLTVLHYAEHSEANLLDARTYPGRVINSLMRQGRIRGAGVAQALAGADVLATALNEVQEQRDVLRLDAKTAARMGGDSWPLRKVFVFLPTLTVETLGKWLPDAAAAAYGQRLKALRYAVLDELLTAEELVAQAYAQRLQLTDAPEPPDVPQDFRRRPPGSERQPVYESDWLDRWQRSRTPLGAASRLIAASLLVVIVSAAGLAVGGQGSARQQFQRGMVSSPGEAAQWYKMAADQGLAEAQNNLGVLYKQGKGVPLDPIRAVQLFRQSAQQGNVQAEANLGFAYLNGSGVARDDSLAGLWLGRAAEKGVAAAQVAVGMLYTKGDGEPLNLQSAASWFHKAADQGDPQGALHLAFAYLNGAGVEKSPSAAVFWFGRAAEKGIPQARTGLGIALLNGEGVAKDPARAVELFRLAAQQGDVVAEANLGFAYTSGLGVAQDLSEGSRWSMKAALQGNSAAQVNIGLDYFEGRGVAKDPSAAVAWFEKAALQGSPAAETNLGIAYAKGNGVKQDDKVATEWFRKAAEQNLAAGEFSYGVRLYQGLGVTADRVAGLAWLNKAAAQDFAPARKALATLNRRAAP